MKFDWLIARQSNSDMKNLTLVHKRHPEIRNTRNKIKNMAESVGAFEFYLQETLKDLSENGKQIDLKPEQGTAMKSLVHGQDVLAILPSGFGKSAIYQIRVRVKEKMLKDCACVLVICPLRSLMEDQIKEAKSMGLTANSLPEASLADVRVGKFQLLFSSAENALDKNFLEILKRNCKFQSSLAAIVVDESHTVETWTGKRYIIKLF